MPSLGLGDSYISLVDSLSAIRQLSEINLERISESGLLEEALNALVGHQDLERCSIFLLEDNQLVCAAGCGIGEQLHSHQSFVSTDFRGSKTFAIGEGLMGIACKTGKVQQSVDCSNDERIKPFRNTKLFWDGGSLISVPLKSSEQVLGALNVSHPTADFFETWHQHFLMLFSNCLGRFLHVHRLLHELENVVRDRTVELEQALTESEDLRQRYQRLSTTDELTGLHNRRYFFVEGESMLSRALRYELPISLLLMDVDFFKRINDRWGHAVGDRVLRMISGVLRETIRTGDLIARLGGEEFVLLLPNTGPVGADLLAKRIQERIGLLDLGGEMQELALTVSIGMTSLESSAKEDLTGALYLLYKQADTAMYLCKRQGRNRRLFYAREMDTDSE